MENHEREYAFGESEVRLLTTIASSMGVALQSALLFDETQRLLKETEQRNAELAVINSIQQGMAGSLDFKGIVDLVGDKLREVFKTGDHRHRLDRLRRRNVQQHLRVRAREAARHPASAADRVAERRGAEPVLYHTAAEQIAAGNAAMEGTDQSLSFVNVQIVASDRVLGRLQLENHEREHAFGEAELRLLETVASSMGVALRERAPLRRDAAPAEGDRAAQRRARSDQQHPAGHGRLAGLPGHHQPRRRQAARGAEERRHRHPLDRSPDARSPFPVRVRARRAPCHPAPSAARTTSSSAASRASIGTVAEQEAAGLANLPGHRPGQVVAQRPDHRQRPRAGPILLEDHQREHAYGPAEVRLLQTVASSMGVALEAARLFDETQRRTRESAALAEVGRDISSTLDLPTVMNRIAHHAKELLAARPQRDLPAGGRQGRRRRRRSAPSSRRATMPRR